ncbi:hypothetical protein MXB_5016 [Myxobolus squamalis]|nr:hypothetical protein MXB_5016 [Myxobolus squamalis]
MNRTMKHTCKNLFNSLSCRILVDSNRTCSICPYITFDRPSFQSRKFPIVFLHGILGNKNNWRNIGLKLNTIHGFNCYSLDSRHHGDWGPCSKFDYFTLADDLKNFMTHLEIKKIHLVGHSMGGKTAMAFSQLYPDLIKSLTIVDIAPIKVRQADLIYNYIHTMFSIDLTGDKSKKDIRNNLVEKLKDENLCDFIMMNLKTDSDGKLRWSFTPDAFLKSFQEIATFPSFSPNFHGPTLFIVGELSEYVNKDDYPSIKKLYSTAKIHQVLKVGHLIHFEAPDQFLQILSQYIKLND